MGTLQVTSTEASTLIEQYRAIGVHRVVLGLIDLTQENYRPVLERAAAVMRLV